MGYRTDYTLKITDGAGLGLDVTPEQCEEIHKVLVTYDGPKWAFDLEGISPSSLYETVCGCKWYEHESDMRIVSKMFPNVLFTLSGEGEENGDIWKKYFLGGKCQVAKAKIEIAPFNPKELR